MESFRKAHSERRIQKGIRNSKPVDLKVKLKKLLQGYSKNDMNALCEIANEENNASYNDIVYSDTSFQSISQYAQKTDAFVAKVASPIFDQILHEEKFVESSEHSSSIEFDMDNTLASQIRSKLASMTVEEASETNSDSCPSLVNEESSSSNRQDQQSPISLNSSLSDSVGRFIRPPSDVETSSNTSLEIQEILESRVPHTKKCSRSIPHNLKENEFSYSPVCLQVRDLDKNYDINEFFDNYTSSIYEMENKTLNVVDDFTVSNSSVMCKTNKEEIEGLDSDNVESENIHSENYVNDSPQILNPNEEYIDQTLDESLMNSDNINIFKLETGCIIVMKHPASLYFHGKLKACALCGYVEVYGYKLGQKYEQIFAPRNGPCLYFETVSQDCEKYGLFGKLTNLGVSIADTENIVTSLSEWDVVLHMLPVSSKLFSFVENMFGTKLLFEKPLKVNNFERYFDAADALNCSFYQQKPQKCLEIDTQWIDIVSHSSDMRGRTILCGGKGIGKSTLLRYYVNKIIEKGPVLVIDLDPGQSEFTCAGNVSATKVEAPLLGPNFTHLRKPTKSLHIGMINIYDSINYFIMAVTQLIDYCYESESLSNMPWIVNTMGLCNAVGEKLMSYIIMKICATLIVQLNSQTQNKCFQSYLTYEYVRKKFEEYSKKEFLFKQNLIVDSNPYEFILIDQNSNVKYGNLLKPKDERYLSFLAYFGECLDGLQSENILEFQPFVVSTKDLTIGVNVDIREDQIEVLLNAKLVALCSDTLSNNNKLYRNKKLVEFIGYGLVRGVDLEKHLLYIITPISMKLLQQVNTLVYSDWLPTLELSHRSQNVGTFIPYHTALSGNSRTLLNAPQRRFNPLQWLRLKKNDGV